MRSSTISTSTPGWTIATLFAGLSLGCVGPEQEVVEQYLAATQRGDTHAVAAISMASFPAEVESWNVLEIGPARRQPYLVPELRQRVEAVEDERDAQSDAFGDFRRANYDSLRRIKERVIAEPEYHFPGQLGELQDAWDLFRLERRQVASKLHDAEVAFEQEIRRVNKSLQSEQGPRDLSGGTVNKDARVRVTTPEGDRHYIMTLTRYELKNQFDALVGSRWIVTTVTLVE